MSIRCKKCGYELKPEEILCKNCNTKISDIQTDDTLKTNTENSTYMYSLNGCGTTLYGKADFNAVDQTYIATRWFILLGLPIMPLGSYRVTIIASSGSSMSHKTQYVMRKVDWNVRQIVITYLGVYGIVILLFWLLIVILSK